MGKTSGRVLRPPAERPMRELHGLTRELQAIQQAAKDATAAARRDQFSRGRELSVVFDGLSGTKKVSHGLGRKPEGVTVKRNPDAVTYTMGDLTSKTITFTDGGTAGTVVFWVY